MKEIMEKFNRLMILDKLASKEASLEKIVDLPENAKRRINNEMMDDAAARLYRVIEAVAQYRLTTRYGLSNQELKELSGLKGLYVLLEKKDDPIGEKYSEGKGKIVGLLQARNSSILAHGWEPVKINATSKLLEVAESLTETLFQLEERSYQEERAEVQHPNIDPETLLQLLK